MILAHVCLPSCPEFSSGLQTHAPRCGSCAEARRWSQPSPQCQLCWVYGWCGPAGSGSVRHQRSTKRTPLKQEKNSILYAHIPTHSPTHTRLRQLLVTRAHVLPGSGRQPGCGRWCRKPPPQTPPEPQCRDSSAPEPAGHKTTFSNFTSELQVIEKNVTVE